MQWGEPVACNITALATDLSRGISGGGAMFYNEGCIAGGSQRESLI